MRHVKTLILGAGPTGLGAAHRLQELGETDWLVVDRAPGPGGLASSTTDEQGFTWDRGVHVLHSHYDYFDGVMASLPIEWNTIRRESWAWLRDTWVPYPVQLNFRHLPPAEVEKCLLGLLEAKTTNEEPDNAGKRLYNFRDWLFATYGRGLADLFMVPYNEKIWAHPLESMGTSWVGDRVTPVGFRRVLSNLVHDRNDTDWGPNATFTYPLRGGTGAIWKALAATLPQEKLLFKHKVLKVYPQGKGDERFVVVDDGSAQGFAIVYENLINTTPLDDFCKMTWFGRRAGSEFGYGGQESLKYSSTHVVGVGFRGAVPKELASKSWIYFSEPEVPFYRATILSNYSPHMAPEGTWSVLCEVAESRHRPVDEATIVEQVERGLRQTIVNPLARWKNMIEWSKPAVVSRWHVRLEHGYPTPFLGRDELVAEVDAELRKHGILSRGRFGSWKYEKSNMDASFMQGVEAVDFLISGKPERTWCSSTFEKRS